MSKNNTLIPRYDIFKAHENKGYQELIKKELGINSLTSMYFGNLEGLEKYKKNLISYPFILKEVTGAGSTSVFKIEDYNALKQKVLKLNKPHKYVKHIVKKIVKKMIFKKRYSSRYYAEDQFTGQVLIQEFMKDLTEDWKVLIFGDKFYVLNRKVRDNDFRASGSGELSFIDPPKEVLDYAKDIYLKLDVPYLSLDIGFDGDKSNLIEFQGTHFGPYTLVNSKAYYKYQNRQWVKVKNVSILEEEYVKSTINYVENFYEIV